MVLQEIYNYKHKLAGTPLIIRALYIFPAFVLALFSNSVAFNISVILIYVFIAQLITKISLKRILRLYTYPVLFIVLGCLTIAFSFNSSTPIFPNSQLNIGFDSENIRLATQILSRSIALVCIVIFWLLTNTISEISEAMRFLRIPNLFIEIFVLTYKFIFNLSTVSKIMYTAQLSRQGYMKRNKVYAFTQLFSAVFRKAMQQSHQLAIAADVRLGNGCFYFLRKKNCFRMEQLITPTILLLLLLTSFLIVKTHG